MSVALDTFANFQGGLQSPPRNAFGIAPSDTLELPFVTRAIYVGGAGDLTLRLAGDTAAQIIKAVPVGAMLPLRVRQIYATGTVASQLVGSISPTLDNPPLRLAQLVQKSVTAGRRPPVTLILEVTPKVTPLSHP